MLEIAGGKILIAVAVLAVLRREAKR